MQGGQKKMPVHVTEAGLGNPEQAGLLPTPVRSSLAEWAQEWMGSKDLERVGEGGWAG